MDDLNTFITIYVLIGLALIVVIILWSISRVRMSSNMRHASRKVADNKLAGKETNIRTIIEMLCNNYSVDVLQDNVFKYTWKLRGYGSVAQISNGLYVTSNSNDNTKYISFYVKNEIIISTDSVNLQK